MSNETLVHYLSVAVSGTVAILVPPRQHYSLTVRWLMTQRGGHPSPSYSHWLLEAVRGSGHGGAAHAQSWDFEP